MAEETAAAAPKTTTPRTRRTTAAKPATTTKAAAAPKTAKATVKVDEPLKVTMEYQSDTARYAKFGFPAELQGTIVGNVYAPPGTAKVLVLFIPEETPTE